MKNKILELLKTQFPGVDETTLSRIAEKLATTATTEELATTAAAGVTFQQVLESHTDFRVNQAVATAVTNYEKKHGLKEGKPTKAEGGDDPDAGKSESEKMLKALLEQNKLLEQRLNAIDNGKTNDGRKGQITKALETLKEGDPFRNRILEDFDRLTFKDDDDFAAYVTKISTDATTLAQSQQVRGAAFQRPAGGGHDTKDEKIPDAIQKVIDAKGKGTDDQPF